LSDWIVAAVCSAPVHGRPRLAEQELLIPVIEGGPKGTGRRRFDSPVTSLSHIGWPEVPMTPNIRFGITSALAVAGFVLAGPVLAQQRGAQQQQQQQQMTPQQMQQHVQQQAQRMEQIAMRAQDMSRTMTQQMSQVREQNRDQLRLLQQLCDQVGVQARETKRTMDQLHQMLQDRTLLQDRDMQQDMDRLRLHSTQVGDGMQEMLNAIDRIQTRLRVR
jgi:hypothetical protein